MEPQPKKFDLQDHGQPLQIFVFTIQAGPMTMEMNEDIQTIMAHDEVSAMQAVRKNYQPGQLISIRRRVSFPIERLLKAINLDPMPSVIKTEIPPLASRELKEREFINAVLYIADRFVKEKRDQTSLKRIINKVLKNYERSKENPVS